jgi:hypothetical protein
MLRSFGSAALLAAALVSAIGCYTISLKVSSERAQVDRLRAGIVADNRDIRMLQSELRTRARLPELQRWNDSVLALSPPTAHQFVRDSVLLASYAPGTAAKPRLAETAPVQVSAPRVAPNAPRAAPAPFQAPQTLQPAHPLAPGIRQIAYTVGSSSSATPALTAARIAPERLAPIAAKPVAVAASAAPKASAGAGIDADLVSAVEAAAGSASEPVRKVPMQ